MSRSFILGIIAWLAAASPASAGSPGSSLLMSPPATPKASAGSKPAASRPAAVTGNPCGAYGASFVRVEGTDTCVKVGGALSVEMGTSARR
ncbi:porin [Bradyrhizobium sp. ORS 375]|uniref:porin n=1 Tax=Bradyrhizobium sp. (strain ORS 375) TaxID=566679 RepID=UPI0009FD2E35|nr:porin [Bradyrhizobium sp. ORS 375]